MFQIQKYFIVKINEIIKYIFARNFAEERLRQVIIILHF